MNYVEFTDTVQMGDEWSVRGFALDMDTNWHHVIPADVGKTVAEINKERRDIGMKSTLVYRRPIAAPCPPTQRNASPCERCRRMEELIRLGDKLVDAIEKFQFEHGPERQDVFEFDLEIAIRNFRKAVSRARPEIEGNDG